MRGARRVWRHHPDRYDTSHSRAGHKITKWRMSIPFYDIRECPRCAISVVGRLAQGTHDREHELQDSWQEDMAACLWALHEGVKSALAAAGIELEIPEFSGQADPREADAPAKLTGYIVGEHRIQGPEYYSEEKK